MIRRLKLGLLTATLLSAVALSAAIADIDRASLYRAQSVTNGFGEENRARGLAPSLEEVLVKVSGDPRLIGDRRVTEASRHAADYLAGFTYRDFLNNRPPNHEQGTYDRPQYLIADFDPGKIDALLASLGRMPWPLPRPKIIALLDITPMRGDPFTLTDDGGGKQAADMRGALTAAAERAGIPLRLPRQDEIAAIRRTASTPRMQVENAKPDYLLVGGVVWREEALGWVADWELAVRDDVSHWQIRGVGFDDAFRNAMRGTAQILSNNGQPQAVVTAR